VIALQDGRVIIARAARLIITRSSPISLVNPIAGGHRTSQLIVVIIIILSEQRTTVQCTGYAMAAAVAVLFLNAVFIATI
jgi:hypothetical protein